MSERVEGMAEEQKQAPAPGGAPRREGGPGGGGPGGPGGRPRGKRQYFRKKKVCKFCVEKMDFIDYKRADILSQFVQELRETTCKLFFKKTSISWATAATWSP